MDKELIEYFDERFRETFEQITALREEIRLVAEGVASFDAVLDSFNDLLKGEIARSSRTCAR